MSPTPSEGGTARTTFTGSAYFGKCGVGRTHLISPVGHTERAPSILWEAENSFCTAAIGATDTANSHCSKLTLDNPIDAISPSLRSCSQDSACVWNGTFGSGRWR
jgi:hypothetical protein